MPHWTKKALPFSLAVLVLVAVSGTATRGQSLEWRDFEDALRVADSTDRFVMVAVYAPWCGWCRKMKTDVYPSPPVRSCLNDHYVLTRLNRDDTDRHYRYRGRRVTPRQLASTLRADEVPTTVLLSPDGDYLLHLSGAMEPRSLRRVLAYVSSEAYRHTPFERFRKTSTGCGDRWADRPETAPN